MSIVAKNDLELYHLDVKNILHEGLGLNENIYMVQLKFPTRKK